MAFLLLLLLLAAALAAIEGRRASEFARKINFDRLEEEWQEGEESEALKRESEFELERMDYHRHRMEETWDPAVVSPSNPAKGMAHAQSVLGPSMMFARIHTLLPGGVEATNDDVDRLSFQWRELLYTGGVEVTAYDVGELTILVTIQHGWEGAQLRDFLLAQPEVMMVTWDSVDYFPSGPGGSGSGRKKAASNKAKRTTGKNNKKSEL